MSWEICFRECESDGLHGRSVYLRARLHHGNGALACEWTSKVFRGKLVGQTLQLPPVPMTVDSCVLAVDAFEMRISTSDEMVAAGRVAFRPPSATEDFAFEIPLFAKPTSSLPLARLRISCSGGSVAPTVAGAEDGTAFAADVLLVAVSDSVRLASRHQLPVGLLMLVLALGFDVLLHLLLIGFAVYCFQLADAKQVTEARRYLRGGQDNLTKLLANYSWSHVQVGATLVAVVWCASPTLTYRAAMLLASAAICAPHARSWTPGPQPPSEPLLPPAPPSESLSPPPPSPAAAPKPQAMPFVLEIVFVYVSGALLASNLSPHFLVMACGAYRGKTVLARLADARKEWEGTMFEAVSDAMFEVQLVNAVGKAVVATGAARVAVESTGHVRLTLRDESAAEVLAIDCSVSCRE